MANSAQAKKRARQAEKSRQRNAGQRSEMRTYLKNTLKAIDAGEKANAESAFKLAVPELDKLARKGLIHANKAARHKSRINTRIKAMA
ncbi:MAG TPA: 30S ribosomal protein S20 [Candidatus Tenderia sp.]|nr:30S ribosomal protein S20 [Candidatus Tenderia sp.]